MVKVFIYFNLDFSSVKSKYLLDLFKSLRPAYVQRIVSSKSLANTIFPKVYESFKANKKNVKSCRIILINKIENSILLIVTYNANGEYFFFLNGLLNLTSDKTAAMNQIN